MGAQGTHKDQGRPQGDPREPWEMDPGWPSEIQEGPVGSSNRQVDPGERQENQGGPGRSRRNLAKEIQGDPGRLVECSEGALGGQEQPKGTQGTQGDPKGRRDRWGTQGGLDEMHQDSRRPKETQGNPREPRKTHKKQEQK